MSSWRRSCEFTLSKQLSDYQLIGSFKTQLAIDNVGPVGRSRVYALTHLAILTRGFTLFLLPQGDPLINLTLSVVPQSSEYQLMGSFETTLALDNVDPVDINVSASVVSSGGATSLHFGGTTSSPITVPGLPCLVIDPMALSAYFILSPFKVSSLSLTGGASACGLGSANAEFTYDSSSNSTFFLMEIRPNLPPPLSSDSTAVLTLAIEGTELGLKATFISGIALPILVSPLGFSLEVFVSKTSAMTKMALSGKITSPVTFSSFPAFSIISLGVIGAITLTPSPMTLTSLTLTGAFSVSGYTATGTFLYDPASKATGLLMTVPNLDMQVSVCIDRPVWAGE